MVRFWCNAMQNNVIQERAVKYNTTVYANYIGNLLGEWPWSGQLHWEAARGVAMALAISFGNRLESGPGMPNCIGKLLGECTWDASCIGKLLGGCLWTMLWEWPSEGELH